MPLPAWLSRARRRLGGLSPRQLLTVLGLSVLPPAAVAALSLTGEPPTQETLEREIWQRWVHSSATVEGTGVSLGDLLARGDPGEARRRLDAFGRMFKTSGQQHAFRTQVRRLQLDRADGRPFASWVDPEAPDQRWSSVRVSLHDDRGAPLGAVAIEYRFFQSGGRVEALESLSHVARWYHVVRWLVVALVVVLAAALLINLERLQRKDAHLRGQKVLLEFGRQMVHELRNGLLFCTNEAANVKLLPEKVKKYVERYGQALEQAADASGVDPAQARRLRRAFDQALADERVDPALDLAPAAAYAESAVAQHGKFYRYLRLVIDELERSLLRKAPAWMAERVSVRAAWEEACDLLELRLEATAVRPSADLAEEEEWVEGDPFALVRVFLNLAKNAIEAMPADAEAREVRLRTRLDAGHVYATVWNSGAPIPPEHLARLFEQGFTTNAGGGRGTGLRVVADVVGRMGGSIRVSSSPNEGTAFHLTFPRSPAAPRR